jgi:hypothetical protein
VVKNANIFQSGEKYKDFSKWSYYNGWPGQGENAKIFQSGLIIMDNLLRCKNAKIFQVVKNIKIFQVVLF